tara:strand:+ start:1732 stop:3240 length:1509 start_codon:yes stop_codon:yes gene_type:complete
MKDNEATLKELNMKHEYGHVVTPDVLVDRMLDVLPMPTTKETKETETLDMKWLDCGAGYGNITKRIIKRIQDQEKTNIAHEITMIEINPDCINQLHNTFPSQPKPNNNIATKIIHQDFLTYDETEEFDIIISNPPYNCHGAIKTPTNTKLSKEKDGKACWRDFVKHAMHLLKLNGHAVFLIPLIWMRKDHHFGIYKLFMYENTTHSIYCMNNTVTNKYFQMKAQTPTCIVHVQKTKPNEISTPLLYDQFVNQWQKIPREISDHETNYGLPTNSIQIHKRLQHFMKRNKRPSLLSSKRIKKTSMPYKNTKLQTHCDTCYPFKNMKTCKLNTKTHATKKQPTAIFEYSNTKTKYHTSIPKLILAHKMFGLPFIDLSGTIGVTNADSYVIESTTQTSRSQQELELRGLQYYLSSPIAIFIYESMRYRMRFLEKEAFDYLPDITKELLQIQKTTTTIHTHTEHEYEYEYEYTDLYDLFGFTKKEREIIGNFMKQQHFEINLNDQVL